MNFWYSVQTFFLHRISSLQQCSQLSLSNQLIPSAPLKALSPLPDNRGKNMTSPYDLLLLSQQSSTTQSGAQLYYRRHMELAQTSAKTQSPELFWTDCTIFSFFTMCSVEIFETMK